MAITAKPKAAPVPSVDVDALINKGGSIAESKSKAAALSNDKAAAVLLRIPSGELSQIDKLVAARRVRTSRHMWLLEAVAEKLDRELSKAE